MSLQTNIDARIRALWPDSIGGTVPVWMFWVMVFALLYDALVVGDDEEFTLIDVLAVVFITHLARRVM